MKTLLWTFLFISLLVAAECHEMPYYFGQFPTEFVWGAGTSAGQIEGAWRSGGRGPSVMDVYSRIPGRTHDGGVADISANSYENYMDDIKNLKALGVSAYHFSLSWSRIRPEGQGTVSLEGVAYYRTLLEALRNNSITPYVTLYDHDLPWALERKGGWMNEDTVGHFVDYAQLCYSLFGSVVKNWITMHDPKGVAWHGYGDGTAPPGIQEPGWNPYIAGRNLILAHVRALGIYKSIAQGGKIGISLTADVFEPEDPNYPDDVTAAESACQFDIGWFANPIFGNGDYPDVMKSQIEAKSVEYGTPSRLSDIRADLTGIQNKTDFLIVSIHNAYKVTHEEQASDPPSYMHDQDSRKIMTQLLSADGIRNTLKWIHDSYHTPMHVTGGFDSHAEGWRDPDRINYFKKHIDQVLKANNLDGSNVVGYVARSLMDCFQWPHGYANRNGLFAVDFSDQTRPRTPRASSRHYAQIVAENGILPGYSGLGGVASGIVPYEDDTEIYFDEFPEDFVWAAATSAYQIEGAWNVDGKGESIWDRLAHTTTSVYNNGTGDVACDSYNKYEEDVKILKNLHVTDYRFSLAWTRLIPTGRLSDGVNQAGIDYYHRVIDELLDKGIRPMVTLYHWDLPQPLEDDGGWLNETIVQHFVDFANLSFHEYGDKVQFWITFNEPPIISILGYGLGIFAPQKKDLIEYPYIVARYLVISHARTYHLYNTTYKPSQNGQIGITINYGWAEPRDPLTVADVRATERAIEFYGGIFGHPIHVDGDFPPVVKEQVAKKNREANWMSPRLPPFSEEEKRLIKGTYDFLGSNFYTSDIMYENIQPISDPPNYYNDQDNGAYKDPTWESTGSDWLKVTPFGLRKMLNWFKYHYNNVPVYITENGVSDRNGTLYDWHRVRFYRHYINEVLKAIKLDGCNVKGYTAWSLMDNFEWLQGYRERFGIHHVDFNDPERPRTQKASAKWYKGLIDDNGYQPGYSRPGGRGTAVKKEKEFYYGTFPGDFIWCAASSSFQIEGAYDADGRGESIWDRFPHVFNNDTGRVACDSYHKYQEDVNLLKNMGVSHYRFSIAWSRIFPDGTRNSLNRGGINYYHRLIDALLVAGIEPMVTLYHWDLPQALQDMGGWTNASIVGHFKDYADVCFQEYASKVKLWLTFNEPWVFLVLGLASGDHAPGHKNPGDEPYRGGHNVLLAHAEAYHLFNDTYRSHNPGSTIGITLNIDWAEPKDPMKPSDIEASELAVQMYLGWFAHPIYINGDYPEMMKTRVATVSAEQGLNVSRLPAFTEEQKGRIKGTFDFFGLNHYTTNYVTKHEDGLAGRSAPNYFLDRGVETEFDPQWTTTGSSWLRVVPWGVRKILNWIRNKYGNVPIYMTENGMSDTSGELDDQHRVHWYRYYINEVLKAINLDKVNVRSYTAWSILDNFEWARGYSERFGLHYVDFNDPERPRTPKASAAFYRHIIRDHGFKQGSVTDPDRNPLPSEDEFYYGNFPDNFVWGAFSSAYQTEGRVDNDGMGTSVWDSFTFMPGRIIDNQKPEDGPMSYVHYEEDVKALKDMGASVYYFSMSWSRVLPSGFSDAVNEKGITFYHKLIDALLEAGIQPIVTLQHFDSPATLGWLDDNIVDAFGNYARTCFKEFGTKVKKWITFNDPMNLAYQAYERGVFAPGVQGRGYMAPHNILKAHATAYRIYQREFKDTQKGEVGLGVSSAWYIPNTPRNPADWFARDLAFAYFFEWLSDPVLLGGDYPDVLRQEINLRSSYHNLTLPRVPQLTAKEKKMIKGSADFLGLTYMSGKILKRQNNYPPEGEASFDDDLSYASSVHPDWQRAPVNGISLYPKGIRQLLRRIKERYGDIPVYVTGQGAPDTPGTINDDFRSDFIKSHTNEILKAIRLDNVDVRGYIYYSLLDGFEWLNGYTVRYGLVTYDMSNQNRTRIPKESSQYYARLIKANGFVRQTDATTSATTTSATKVSTTSSPCSCVVTGTKTSAPVETTASGTTTPASVETTAAGTTTPAPVKTTVIIKCPVGSANKLSLPPLLLCLVTIILSLF